MLAPSPLGSETGRLLVHIILANYCCSLFTIACLLSPFSEFSFTQSQRDLPTILVASGVLPSCPPEYQSTTELWLVLNRTGQECHGQSQIHSIPGLDASPLDCFSKSQATYSVFNFQKACALCWEGIPSKFIPFVAYLQDLVQMPCY